MMFVPPPSRQPAPGISNFNNDKKSKHDRARSPARSKPHDHNQVQSHSRSRSSSLRRSSFDSIEEDNSGIAQSFVDSKADHQPKHNNNNQVDGHHDGSCPAVSSHSSRAQAAYEPPAFCCPCGGFRGWKRIPLGGRRQSRSFSDLRLLGSSDASRGWAWDEAENEKFSSMMAAMQERQPPPVVEEVEEPPMRKNPHAALDMMPPEILDQVISLLFVDIPPNGYTPRNVDLISCLLTCRTIHSATLGVLYRNITIPHSIIFSKALSHLRQYPSLATIVRRLDFSHFTSVGLGRTQRMNVDIQNLTSSTLLDCLSLLPNLKELLLQEHLEDDIDARVSRAIFCNLPALRAVDFCGCSSSTFSKGFVSALVDNPDLPALMPRLRRVSLHECTTLPDAAFRALLPRLENLTHLDVAHTQISNETLRSIHPSADITHLNIARCTKLVGADVVDFLTNHPAVRDGLLYLNLMSDATRHVLLEEEDVDALLPTLSPSLRSLNLGGAKISSRHMPLLVKLSKHLDELGLNSAHLTIEDLNRFFAPPPASSSSSTTTSNTNNTDASTTPWTRPEFRYLDLTKNPFLTQGSLLNPKTCLLASPQSYPVDVIELSEKIISPLRQRNSRGWVVRDLGRRAWYVREPMADPETPPDDGRRGWKMGARWWGMRKVPVAVGDVGGIYGHYMFKK